MKILIALLSQKQSDMGLQRFLLSKHLPLPCISSDMQKGCLKQAAYAQISLHIFVFWLEPLLFVNVMYGPREIYWLKMN